MWNVHVVRGPYETRQEAAAAAAEMAAIADTAKHISVHVEPSARHVAQIARCHEAHGLPADPPNAST